MKQIKGPNLKPYVLLVGTSLRASRYGKAKRALIDDINKIKTEIELNNYLKNEATLHYESFTKLKESGKDYLESYKVYRKTQNSQGLSNSEVALAATAWEIQKNQIDIKFFNVSELINIDSLDIKGEKMQHLKQLITDAAGVLVSTPVYFGDRSSLCQLFIDLCNEFKESGTDFSGKFFAGCSVGAKRNGGQETSLIYLAMDLLNLGFNIVGNDSKTTSQYGGTVHAGDLGTAANDQYGLNTCLGTGRRMARVISQNILGTKYLAENPKVNNNPSILLINFTSMNSSELIDDYEEGEINIIGVDNIKQIPCIACDVCPTHVGPDEEYRCILKKGKNETTQDWHQIYSSADIIIPIAEDNSRSLYSYQKFMERTRHLRRGDYVWGDAIVFPTIVYENGISDLSSMHFRLMTSFMRHHTIIKKPQKLEKFKDIKLTISKISNSVRTMTLGRYMLAQTSQAYQPIGYYLSTAKEKEDFEKGIRHIAVQSRTERFAEKVNSLQNK